MYRTSADQKLQPAHSPAVDDLADRSSILDFQDVFLSVSKMVRFAYEPPYIGAVQSSSVRCCRSKVVRFAIAALGVGGPRPN